MNFLGPYDEFVVSGSDDGNFFIWDKATGKLHGIYEGDGSVVNVVEGHPHLPLVAVSGIDTTVKVVIIPIYSFRGCTANFWAIFTLAVRTERRRERVF